VAVSPRTIGQTIADSASIGGLSNGAGGTITFVAYAPLANGAPDTNCSTSVFTSVAFSVNGPGPYSSGNFTPTTIGVYEWRAFYSGDVNNAAVSTPCNDTNEQSQVNKAQPAIVTTASSTTIGGSISDSATISGLVSPSGGSITFNAYAPNADGTADTTCSNSVYTKVVSPISANGTVGSGNFTPTGVTPQIAGVYEWIASFSGDAKNEPVSGTCNATNEQSTVNKHPSSVPTGQKLRISDKAQVVPSDALGGTPTGTVTFQLFDNASCLSSPTPPNNKVYDSGPVTLSGGVATTPNPPTVSANGTYFWKVSYSGDNVFGPATGACGDEQVTTSGNTPGVDP
jgi:hypothetical protein